jgi:hypothetical protein
MGYSYDRRTARHSDPRIQVNRQHIDRFFGDAARRSAEIGQAVKDEFIAITDIANRLEREGDDERKRAYWSDRLKRSAKVLIENSKAAQALWKDLVHADAVINER